MISADVRPDWSPSARSMASFRSGCSVAVSTPARSVLLRHDPASAPSPEGAAGQSIPTVEGA
jgi:hypothetical protein